MNCCAANTTPASGAEKTENRFATRRKTQDQRAQRYANQTLSLLVMADADRAWRFLSLALAWEFAVTGVPGPFRSQGEACTRVC